MMVSWIIESDSQEELEQQLNEVYETAVGIEWTHKIEVLPDGRRICYVSVWTDINNDDIERSSEETPRGERPDSETS